MSKPMSWAVIYHSHYDVFEIKIVEDKMVADGYAEDADKTTEGNMQVLTLPAHKLLEACIAYDRLINEKDVLLEALKAMWECAGGYKQRKWLHAIEKADKALALCKKGATK